MLRPGPAGRAAPQSLPPVPAAITGAVGRQNEAISLLEQNVAGQERILGSLHPDAVKSRGNLALAYQAAGRVDEAIPLLEQALATSERVLGPDHHPPSRKLREQARRAVACCWPVAAGRRDGQRSASMTCSDWMASSVPGWTVRLLGSRSMLALSVRQTYRPSSGPSGLRSRFPAPFVPLNTRPSGLAWWVRSIG
jgi:tetratricopeptide repeat protein